MYWVLTSEKYPTAIRGTDARGGISLVTADKPLAPLELNDKIPIALSKLVMECCRANPAERPASMKQVAARLAVVQKLWRQHRENMRAQRREALQPAADRAERDTDEPLAARDRSASDAGPDADGDARLDDQPVQSAGGEE